MVQCCAQRFSERRLMLARPCNAAPRPNRRKAAARAAAKIAASTPEEVFHLHRQAQSQRSRTLSALVIQVEGDYSIRCAAPRLENAMAEAWGPASSAAQCVVARAAGRGRRARMAQKGVEIAALGDAPCTAFTRTTASSRRCAVNTSTWWRNAAAAPRSWRLTSARAPACFAAVLARRGVRRVVATENAHRALACAGTTCSGWPGPQVTLQDVDLFPEDRRRSLSAIRPGCRRGRARPSSTAVYDEGSRMLQAFLAGTGVALAPGGEGWLVLSDLAEHLGHAPARSCSADRCRRPARARTPRCAPVHAKATASGDAAAGCACGRSHVVVAAGCDLRWAASERTQPLGATTGLCAHGCCRPPVPAR